MDLATYLALASVVVDVEEVVLGKLKRDREQDVEGVENLAVKRLVKRVLMERLYKSNTRQRTLANSSISDRCSWMTGGWL